MSGPDPVAVGAALDAIERELHVANLWASEPPTPEQYQFKQAFAMDTMDYARWLQFIFIPRVREIIATNGTFPASSSVGTQAIREFDGDDRASRLVNVLCEFDVLFEPVKR
jgi:uncharacterized protein YqcC (DUF446 family)